MPWSTCAVVGGCLLHCLSVRDVGCGSRLRTDCSPARCRLRHARVAPGSRLGGLQYKGLLRSIADGVLGVGYVVAFSNDLADRAGEPSDRAGYLAAVASAALTRTFQIDANVGGLRKLGVAAGEGATSSPGVWQARGRCGRDGLWWGRGHTVGLDRTVRMGHVFAANPGVSLDVSGGRRCQPACNATFLSIGLTWAGVLLPRSRS